MGRIKGLPVCKVCRKQRCKCIKPGPAGARGTKLPRKAEKECASHGTVIACAICGWTANKSIAVFYPKMRIGGVR